MEGIGQFDHSSQSAIPRHDRNGRLYTEDQRKQIADRRGLCLRCGITTHEKTRILGRKALSNENVFEGTCIRCNPRKVPQHIYDAWEAKHRPQMTASVTPVHPTSGSSMDSSNSSIYRRGHDSHHRFPAHLNPGHGRTSSTGSANGPSPTRTPNNHSKPASASLTSMPSMTGQRSNTHPPAMATSMPAMNSRNFVSGAGAVKQAHFDASQRGSAGREMRGIGESVESLSINDLPRHGQGPGPNSKERNTSSLSNDQLFDSSVPRGLDGAVNSNRSFHACESSTTKASSSGEVHDSQRSVVSGLTTSTSESNRDGHQEEKQTTAVEDEKAALGFTRQAPATVHGVQSFSNRSGILNESSESFSPSEENKSAFESEKAALGIVRSTPATKPGVESFYSSNSIMDSSEPQSTVKTTTAADPKAAYRSSPALKPGVQGVSSSRGVAPSRSEQSLRGNRSEDDIEQDSSEFVSRTSSASKMPPSVDLKLSLQDDYKGDETKLPTTEYMQQLADNLDDPSRLRRVLHNLRNIEDDDQSDILHQIKVILSHCASDPRVGDVAVGVLWRTAAVGTEAKNEVMQSGAIDVVLDCLRQQKEDHEFCQWVLGVLTSVAFNVENKELIADKGGIEQILEVLALQKKNAGVFEWACRCLHNLVHCYEEDGDHVVVSKNITSIEESGGIEILIDSMHHHTTETNAQLWAVKLLWRLLDASGTTEIRRRLCVMHRMVVIRKMAAADYVSVASKLLRQQSTAGKLLVYSAELMTVVILGAGGESNMFKYALLLEKASQCASNMIRVMKHMPGDLEIQSAGCRLLSALCNANGNITKDMIELGAMDVIAEAMMNIQQNENVVEPGTWAMWKLSAEVKGSVEDITLDISTIRNVLGLLGTLASTHDDQAIQLAINGFVVNMCGNESLVFDDFPIAALAQGLLRAPLSGGGDVLSLLCSQYPESADMVLQSLTLSAVVTVLNDSNLVVQEHLVPVLIAAAENSAEARNLMMSSGVMSASVAALGDIQNKELCTSLVDLISALSASRVEGNGDSPIPLGFCRTLRSCLENHLSDEKLSMKLMQMAVGAIVQSSLTDEVDSLLPVLVDKIGNSSVPVAVGACNLVWAIASKQTICEESRLSQLFTCIVTWMMKFDGENGHEFSLEVQTAAAGAMSSISGCIRNTPIPIESQQVDSFMGIVYVARNVGQEASGFMVAILTSLWNLCFVHEGVLLQAGVIILVMDIMGAYRSDATVQEKGCLVLAQLASSENIQITLSIVETDGVQMLLEALASFPSIKGIQSEAAKALAHLSTDDETRMLVSAMGGINLLVTSITSFSDDLVLLERAYSALLNLTSDVPEQFLDFAAIVRAIVTTMAMYPHSTSLRENGLGILQNVCMKGAKAKETIAAEGGITTVTNAMENFITTPTVLERSFSTLWSLAVLPANQSRIAKANGISIVVAGMYASIEYERVQQQGCGCMFTLALDVDNRKAFRRAGGVDAVTLSSKAHFGSAGVQVEVCRCLAGLATPGEGSDAIETVSQEEVDAVLFAMQRFTGVEGVQLHGITALFNFLYAGNAPSLISANRGVMKDAVERASNHFYDHCAEVAQGFHHRMIELGVA